ncbi:MAG: adenylate/guanylate cyclase domain-containing protein, partial [Spirulinaceae cyanobacterium]
EMTILFSDIRSFTTISEQMTPGENFAFINSYLGQMEPLIEQYGGFIDKYIGDAIMALFGNSPDDALQAAIAMLQELQQYNQNRQQNNRPPLRIGIGLHTGRLMLGTVGGADRMDGTAIGDSVNLSSRVEGLTKTYGIPLLITQQTFLGLKDPFEYDFRFIERVTAKGKAKAVSLFEVFSADPPDLRRAKNASKGRFEKGVLLFHQQAFNEAAALFQECWEHCQDDRAAQMYRDRCQQQIR